MNEDRCPTCGARVDSDERAAAEIALARILALMKRPAGLAQFEQVLRNLTSLRSGIGRVIELEQERVSRG